MVMKALRFVQNRPAQCAAASPHSSTQTKQGTPHSRRPCRFLNTVNEANRRKHWLVMTCTRGAALGRRAASLPPPLLAISYRVGPGESRKFCWVTVTLYRNGRSVIAAFGARMPGQGDYWDYRGDWEGQAAPGANRQRWGLARGMSEEAKDWC